MNEFDKVGLYDHNALGYKEVKKTYESSNVVGTVRATGTGKTYIGTQLVYDNKDLKTLWIVPNNSIIEHIIKSINDNPNLDMDRDFPNLQFMTYQNLVNMSSEEIEELDIDLLILDEFHHIGAPVWGDRVNTIIETHPNIKVFGMTAYTVRDRGTSYERDMALDDGDELFSNNIVARYDLCDAMIDGVLPKPVYKSSYIKLIDMASQLEERVKKLEASGRECSEYNKILNDVKKRIHEAPSLGEVVKQNVKKNGKYIYFCPPAGEEGTNDIETIKREAMSWFKEIVSEEDIVIYTSLSEMEDSGKSNRDAFYDDLDLNGDKVDNKLRVMFAINQYNEGVHAPNLDGVIMGRGTCSDIVFFEQLGRALSVSSGVKEKIKLYSTYSIERLRLMCSQKSINYNYDMDKNELIEKLVAPFIIDLAGNIDFIRELEDNLKDRIKEYQEKGNGTINKRFLSEASFDLDIYEVELFNILMDLKQKTEMTWDDWYKLAEDYYKEHGNLDVSKGYIITTGEKLGQWIGIQRRKYKNRDLTLHFRKGKIGILTDEQVYKLESIGMIWDVLDFRWGKMYELAKEYYEQYGDLNIPVKYVASNGEKLGQWIATQRIAYKYRDISVGKIKNKNNPLTDEQVFMLENIGMVWDPIDSFWNKMYRLAEKYYKEHGNLNISNRFKTEEGHGLGDWVCRQRKKFKKGELTEKQIDLLISIGIKWDLNDDNWESMFRLAEEYFHQNGDLNIPHRYIASNGEKLGKWIQTQRQAYKNRGKSGEQRKTNNKPLTDEQVSMLESIGMVWNVYESKWEEMYRIAQRYFDEHGNLEVPARFITEDGYTLGIWIHRQRTLLKNGKMPNDQIIKLGQLGMRCDNKISTLTWDEWYKLAQEYNNEHGNLLLTNSYITENGEKLGQWIHRQRQSYKSGNLTEQQIDKLKKIGMQFESKMFSWDDWYELATEYYVSHGNLEIPLRYKTIDGDKLGAWLQRQRTAYANIGLPREKWAHGIAPLLEEQVKKLETIGMVWNILESNWNKMYKLAQEYYIKYENLNLSSKLMDKELYNWLGIQRKAYRNRGLSKEEWKSTNKPLTDKQVLMLESIGMIWDTKKNKSDIEEICKDNTIDIKKNKDIINHISFTEFKIKIAYLKDNGMNIVDENGMLHEIFSMSSMNMKLKYGVSLEDLVNMYGKEKNK